MKFGYFKCNFGQAGIDVLRLAEFELFFTVSRKIIAEIWVAFFQNLSDNLADRCVPRGDCAIQTIAGSEDGQADSLVFKLMSQPTR